jgi:hypothetical protein
MPQPEVLASAQLIGLLEEGDRHARWKKFVNNCSLE